MFHLGEPCVVLFVSHLGEPYDVLLVSHLGEPCFVLLVSHLGEHVVISLSPLRVSVCCWLVSVLSEPYVYQFVDHLFDLCPICCSVWVNHLLLALFDRYVRVLDPSVH